MKWKDVPGYEGLYQASRSGFIRSLDRFTTHKKSGKRKIKGQPIKGLLSKFGYLHFTICNDGKMKRVPVHRIVAKTFLDSYRDNLTVNHKNGIKTDNRAINLEMMSAGDNMRHSVLIGIRDHLKLDGNPASVLSREEAREIRASSENNSELSRAYGVTRKTIRDIKNFCTWKDL